MNQNEYDVMAKIAVALESMANDLKAIREALTAPKDVKKKSR